MKLPSIFRSHEPRTAHSDESAMIAAMDRSLAVIEFDLDGTIRRANDNFLNALGYTLADRTDQLDEALALITKAFEARPDNAAIVDSMGWVLFKLGRVDEALVHLRRAFELQRDPEVGAHLGEALWVSGALDEARSIWRLAEELDASNRTLRRTRERLDP